MSAPACLDLSASREVWSAQVQSAADRGCFRGAIRSEPYPTMIERCWWWLLVMADGHSDGYRLQQ